MPQVAIAGAGIAGLVFALGFKKHLGITPQVYEQAARFGISSFYNESINHH